MNGTQPQPPESGDPGQDRRDINREFLTVDSLAEHLEERVAALEEITATPWPRRILVRARLGRQLRRSVRNFPGETWAWRRANAVSADWLADQ